MAEKGIGSCWDRFERKTLLTFTGYKDRYPGMVKELDRIGMKDVHVQWQFPNPFESVLLKHLRSKRSLREWNGAMSCAMGHYVAIKTAYHLGCKNCLVMEDDIRFLIDNKEIEASVSSLPEDFGIALFDYTALNNSSAESSGKVVNDMRRRYCINERWAGFDNLSSTGCYALSRRGMEKYIWLVEAAIKEPSIGKLRIADHWWNKIFMGNDIRMLFAIKHVAIQRPVVGGRMCRDLDMDSYYRIIGANTELYSRP